MTTDTVAQRPKIYFTPLLFRIALMLPPLRKRVFWLISQLWTNYRESPAVVQSGPVKAGPQAGDRAPYGFFEEGPDAAESIFEVLRGPEHHLLIFEGRNQNPAPPDLRKIEQDLRSLLDYYGVTIRMHTVQKGKRNLHERYGEGSPVLYLVRPDGHVAYRGPAEDPDGIGSYLDDMSGRKWERVEQGVSTQGRGGIGERGERAQDARPPPGVVAVFVMITSSATILSSRNAKGRRSRTKVSKR